MVTVQVRLSADMLEGHTYLLYLRLNCSVEMSVLWNNGAVEIEGSLFEWLQTLIFALMSVSGLRGLCVSELLERLEEVERQIRTFSEELVDQLAVREELDYEKEVKNTFISALIDVQNRQKEHRELLKKKRKIKTAGAEQRSNRSHVPGTVRC